MNQNQRAEAFRRMHVKGDPVVLYNIWDAGSAKSVADAGAKALATGSWSVAAAQGYGDGEAIPLDLLETIVRRISETVALPLSVDFEGGYAVEPEALGNNVTRIIATGAIGINFEDQLVGGEGLHPVSLQAARIAAIRSAADEAGVALFINARTDVFLKERDRSRHGDLLGQAREREQVYREAGADGFFAPGLVDRQLIADLCSDSVLPVNILMMPDAPAISDLAEAGVGRISFGPGPYRTITAKLAETCKRAISAV